MKKILLLSVTVVFAFSVFGQSKSKSPATKENPQKDYDLEMFQQAMRFADYDVAKHALYSLMVHHPDNLAYLDSLTILYYSLKAYPQTVLAGSAFMEKDSTNFRVMEMVALSYSSLKSYKESVDLYDKMFHRTGRVYYAYQLAVHQYLLKRIGEAGQMIDIVVNDPKSETENVVLSSDEGMQEVPLKAAALHLRGAMMAELNMKEQAKESYEASLKVFPGFTMAKKNLEALNATAKTDSLPGKK